MQFDEHKKSRADLASYFVKNAIPTEANFADLISSGLNQRDDGVVKPAGAPLSLAGVEQRGQRRVLDLYREFNNDTPAWSLSVAGADSDGLGIIRGQDDVIPLFVDRASGNVGLGTTRPEATLDVRGAIHSSGPMRPAAGAGGGLLFPPDPGGGGGDAAWLRYIVRPGETNESMTLQLGISNDIDDHISLMPSGNVGIGTDNPTFKLDVRGSLAAGNSDMYFTKTDHTHSGYGNTPGFAAIENASSHGCLMILGRTVPGQGRIIAMWDTVTVNGRFSNNSDRRLKRDIEDSPYGLDAVRRLRAVRFNWRDLPNPHKTVGLIAQEVQGVVDEVVYDHGDTMSVSYLSLIPVLISAIQELDVKLGALEPEALGLA